MEIRGLCSMVFSMCLQSSQLTRLISLRHKPRAYNFCALEPNIPFWRVTYYPPIRKNLSFQILVSEAGCGSGHRELSGFLTLIFIGWSSNKCSSRVNVWPVHVCLAGYPNSEPFIPCCHTLYCWKRTDTLSILPAKGFSARHWHK